MRTCPDLLVVELLHVPQHQNSAVVGVDFSQGVERGPVDIMGVQGEVPAAAALAECGDSQIQRDAKEPEGGRGFRRVFVYFRQAATEDVSWLSSVASS